MVGGHTELTAAQKSKRAPVQQLLKQSCSVSEDKQSFLSDLCYAMVASNIPFNKLKFPPFKLFLQKYTKQNIPDESTLRKNYLKKCFEQSINEIRKRVDNQFIYIMVNETTDPRGLYICSLIIGVLHPDIEPNPYLISCKVLSKINYETLSRFVNDSLTNFFNNISFQDKILLFVSDAAPYMVKAGGALKVFYPNMIHVTCVAHALNRVAEKVRDIFPNVNKLLNNGKKMFLKAPHRVAAYKSHLDCPLPPEPVITRWGTWIEAALFYSNNFV